MGNSLYLTVIPAVVGILAIFVYSQIRARKELRSRETGFKPDKYQDKLPQEYSKNQKIYTLIIALVLLIIFSLALYLFTKKQLALANFVTLAGIAIWRILITVGNRVK